MFTVYIYNYRKDNVTYDGPTVMFTVPLSGQSPVINPVVKCTEDMADAFDFTMESYSPYYDSLIPLKTRLRVEYDGSTIFYGRVLSIQTSTIYNTKQVNCEGAFAYFNDTYYEGKKDKKIKEITYRTFLSRVLKNHNKNYNTNNNPELWKVIRSGTDLGEKSEKRKWESTSWTDTTSCIKSLTDYYGGHMRIRYNASNDNLYLDWYKYYYRDQGANGGTRPKIEITKNLLDISSDNANVDNVFTRLIPIGSTDAKGNTIYVNGYKYKDKNNTQHTYGSNKYIPVNLLQGSNGLYSDSALNDEYHSATEYRDAESNFGIIYKTASFPNADTQKKLWDYATDYIKNNYYGMVTSFSIKAIDMHIQNGSYPKILLGDCVDIVFRGNGTNITKTKLICQSVQYDLFAPENNTYTIGVPSDLMNREYGKKKKKSSKNDPVSTNTGQTQPQENESDPTITWDSIYRMIYAAQGTDPDDSENYWDNFNSDYLGTTAGASFKKNGKLTGSVQCFDPTYTGDQSQRYDNLITGKLFGKLTHSGKAKYVAYCADYGLFACTTNSANPCTVTFTYTHQRGANTTDDDPGTTTQTTTDANGQTTSETTATDDGTPDGNTTYSLKPQQISYPPYDSTKTYTVGAVVQYQSKIYKCKTAINTPEAWNSSHWTYICDVGNKSNSVGNINVGYDVRQSSGDTWRIKLNIPVVYDDEDGHTQVADGFVSAGDFNLPSIPSFKTKLIVADQIIAGKVDAASISADIAYIRKLNASDFYANTQVASQKGKFGTVTAGTVNSNVINYQGTGGMSQIDVMGKIVAAYNFAENNGTIKLQGKFINNQAAAWTDLATFNMAATTFYQNAVAAGANTGWNAARGKIIASDSIPTSSTEQSVPDQTWNIKIPAQNGYSNRTTEDLALKIDSTATSYSYGGATIMTINAKLGSYIAYRRTVSNLKASNIKKDVKILGVTGTYEGSSGNLSFNSVSASSYSSPQYSDSSGHMVNRTMIGGGTIDLRYLGTGEHSIIFNTSNPSGHYFIRIQTS